MTAIFDAGRLPAPLNHEQYRLLRHGVYDDDATAVFVNTDNDFAALEPLPETDYRNYRPRAESLGLAAYKKQRVVVEERRSKIAPLLRGSDSFVEIGAADATFLALLHEHDANRRYIAVEPDDRTRPARDGLAWLTQFASTREAAAAGVDAASIGMFHVFEHVVDPMPMLADVRAMLAPGGQLLIEVPCYGDPLLSVFKSPDYADFYFQRQHPYVYTGTSLGRVLIAAGFTVVETIGYQRYGLENHLQWLRNGVPGGNPRYREIFANVDEVYRRALEIGGHTDTVIVVARAAA